MVFIGVFTWDFLCWKLFLAGFPVVCQGLRRYEVVSTDHLFGNIPEENFLLYPVAWWWWEVVTVSLLCCLQNRGISVSEAVNRNAQCYRGEVCIFNVLYQIDVFLGHDEGITTEAVHNAIKCTVAFRRIQYTDWKQWWYRRNCLSWFIKVGGRILLCRNHVFIHFSIQSAFKYYLTNILAELQGIRDKLLRINVLVTLNKRQVLCCYFQWSKFCKGKGSDAVKERLFLSRREKTTYRIFVWLSNFWGCPGIHSGHDR